MTETTYNGRWENTAELRYTAHDNPESLVRTPRGFLYLNLEGEKAGEYTSVKIQPYQDERFVAEANHLREVDDNTPEPSTFRDSKVTESVEEAENWLEEKHGFDLDQYPGQVVGE